MEDDYIYEFIIKNIYILMKGIKLSSNAPKALSNIPFMAVTG